MRSASGGRNDRSNTSSTGHARQFLHRDDALDQSRQARVVHVADAEPRAFRVGHFAFSVPDEARAVDRRSTPGRRGPARRSPRRARRPHVGQSAIDRPHQFAKFRSNTIDAARTNNVLPYMSGT